MSVTISYRTLVAFVTGVAACVIAVFMFQALRVDAAPGDVDATFVAITPCRLIDTRANPDFHVGPHSTFGANDTKTVQARGTNGNCTIPTDAVGLSMNVTAVDATTPSFLTIWPDGARPKASSLNPVPGQPPTPNAVATNLSGVGSFKIFNLAGTVDVIVDVNGFYSNSSLRDLDERVGALETAGVPAAVLDRLEALEADNVALQSAVAALESKTAAISIEDAGSTVRFTGVDVQIVDGSGDTKCGDASNLFEDCNGSGNLIVGYNEDDGGDEVRSGSHNIVTGTDNDYQSHSGILAGSRNTTSGEFATVTGGFSNTASGFRSSVSGGNANTASGSAASVSGGNSNTASGLFASVSGGIVNTAIGNGASVSGGRSNTASGTQASVSGGEENTASGTQASVSGGSVNTASALVASVSGGDNNTASGTGSWVSGGGANTAIGNGASVSGGSDNTASALVASVSGGNNNLASGLGSSVSGGDAGTAVGDFAVVVGGSQNQATGPRAVAVGGGQNVASGSKAVVSGGDQRDSSSTFDWRAGGLFQDS